MAIYFWHTYHNGQQFPNFGDDLNPWLLGKLFSENIINEKNICLVGIGTLLDKNKMAELSGYKKKIIFSTGAGYGEKPDLSDKSWDIVCVRGPKTAEWLGIETEKGISDGATLLSDYYQPVRGTDKEGIVFVPHIRTHLRIGVVLKNICDKISIKYLPPNTTPEVFITEVNNAELALCEAMHGAITADTLRTPWICCQLLYHNEFKWRDWCASVGVPYHIQQMKAELEWKSGSKVYRGIWKLKRPLERAGMGRELQRASIAPARLSEPEVLNARKENLRDIVKKINEKYG